MLNRLLSFKRDFITNSSFNGIHQFVSELRDFNNKNTFPEITSDLPYWENYVHAVLMSIYLGEVGINLDNWRSYAGQSGNINSILGLDRFTESSVLEFFIMHYINKDLNFPPDINIIALRANSNNNPTYLTDDGNDPNFLTPEQNNYLLKNLKIIMRVRGIGTQEIWGDNDLIVCIRERDIVHSFCIISCKTSLRERVYQSIFWATHSRIEGIAKHVFITLDKGSSGSSEIGDRNQESGKAKKSRNALESTMDRVYVFRSNNEVNRSHVIKDLDYLKDDLLRWAKDYLGI